MSLKPSRPHMPGYGIRPASEGGLLPWSFVSESMAAARNYWVSSTRPDGRPHAVPVWGLWHADVFFFSSGKGSRKARNFEITPAAVVHLESGDEVVVLEGRVELVDEDSEKQLLATLDGLYKAKYGFPFLGLGNIYRLKAQNVLAWREGDFPTSATRWRAG